MKLSSVQKKQKIDQKDHLLRWEIVIFFLCVCRKALFYLHFLFDAEG